MKNPTTWSDPFGEDGHHTIPKQLMDEMADQGIIDPGKYGNSGLAKYKRPGLADLDRPVHHNAHKSLTDYVREKHGVQMKNGYQTGKNWKDYLSKRNSAGKVLGDLRDYYDKWLPEQIKKGKYKDLKKGLPDLQKGFRQDARKLRGCK